MPSRIQFPGRETLFILILATMMMLPTGAAHPHYLIVWRLGLASSVAGVVIQGLPALWHLHAASVLLEHPMDGGRSPH